MHIKKRIPGELSGNVSKPPVVSDCADNNKGLSVFAAAWSRPASPTICINIQPPCRHWDSKWASPSAQRCRVIQSITCTGTDNWTRIIATMTENTENHKVTEHHQGGSSEKYRTHWKKRRTENPGVVTFYDIWPRNTIMSILQCPVFTRHIDIGKLLYKILSILYNTVFV